MVTEQRWIRKCSNSQSIQVEEDSRLVSPPFPDFNPRELREEDQTKEEDNEEENKLIISNEGMVKQRTRRRKKSNSHNIHAVKDRVLVSLPFLDFNTRKPEEEDNEAAKKIVNEKMVMEQRWIKKCSSSQSVQVVEDSRLVVSPPFPNLDQREPREEDQAKEEEMLIISNEVMVKQRRRRSISHSIQAVEDSIVSVPFPDFNPRKPIEEDNEAAKRNVNEKMVMEQRWIRKCSNSQSIHVVEDSRLVSPPFPDLDPRELTEEDKAKEEDNEEEEKLTISNEGMVKQRRRRRKKSSSQNIQAVEDSELVSLPFPDFNRRKPIEEDNEAAKKIVNEKLVMEQRRIRKCSSSQSVQVVEDSKLVSPPFPDLDLREPREEDQAKEEEEMLIINNEVMVKQRRSSISHSIQAVEDSVLDSFPVPDFNTRKPIEEDNEAAKKSVNEKMVMKQRWIRKCSSSQSVQVVEDSELVSPPFPDLDPREQGAEDQAKEEEEMLTISNEGMVKQRRRRSSSYGIQAVEDSMLVSVPFPKFNTRKPIEEENEAAKRIVNRKMAMEQRWIRKCRNSQSIQVMEDSRPVPPPFPDSDPRELREEDRAKEEDNEEEEKFIISNEGMVKQRRRRRKKKSSSHNIQAVEDSIQAVEDSVLDSLPFPDFNTRKAIEENNEAAKQIVNEKMVLEERWIRKCSNCQSVQVMEDSRLVYSPFPDLDPREPGEVDLAKEEDNVEEEKLIISNEVMMKQICIQKCSSSHSIQAVEDSMQVYPPFPDLDTREPREEEEEEEEKLIISKEKDNEEEEKLTISKQVVMKERWIQYYSSSHKILLVGEGDFSFSASLATAFGSATNMIATSLDSKDVVTKIYKEAKSNLEKLEKLGACILHGIDATKMKLHADLQMRKFDRIIFNFPHAGFHGREDDDHVIRMHKCLLYGFFENAGGMLCADGETHVNHKITVPFCHWNLVELASQNSLALIEYVYFKKEDYPGYNNKRGAGSRCDEPFPLGECSTFKFSFSPTAKEMCRVTNCPVSTHRLQQLQNIPISMLLPHQLPWFQLQPPASMGFRYPQTNFIANVNDAPWYLGLPSSISDSHNCFRCFQGHFNNEVGTFEKTDYDVGYFVPEESRLGYARYMAETLGRTNWYGHIYH